MTPAPEEVVYPVLLDDLPAPNLRVYPRYTVIAEEFEAITSLGIANSRMKDFFDLCVLTRHSELNTAVLRQAIAATFARRRSQGGRIHDLSEWPVILSGSSCLSL